MPGWTGEAQSARKPWVESAGSGTRQLIGPEVTGIGADGRSNGCIVATASVVTFSFGAPAGPKGPRSAGWMNQLP